MFNRSKTKQHSLCSVYLHFQDGGPRALAPHFHECINYSIFFPFRRRWPSRFSSCYGLPDAKPCPYLFNIALFFLLFPSLAATCYDVLLFSTSAAPTEEGKSSIPRLAIRRGPAENPERTSGPPPANHDHHLLYPHTAGGLSTSCANFFLDSRGPRATEPKLLRENTSLSDGLDF